MNSNKQKGVSLIMTFFIMIIILSVVLSISSLLYSQIKTIRNIVGSTVSYYVAESGIEKLIFYDSQVKTLPVAPGASTCDNETSCEQGYVCDDGFCAQLLERGLCYMLNNNNPKYCEEDEYDDSGIYCNNPTPLSFIDTCAPNNCTDCTITFDTTFDTAFGNGHRYYVTAKIDLDDDIYLDVKSNGTFGSAARQIEILYSM